MSSSTESELAALAKQINEHHEAGEIAGRQRKLAGRKRLEHYRFAGQALREAKAKCEHGHWGPWLKTNFPFSHTQANRYMALANYTLTGNLEADEQEWRRISGNEEPEKE